MPEMPTPTIIRSSRTSISFQITRDGELVVKAPRFLPTFLINQAINAKQDWIVEQYQKVQARLPKQKAFVSGEEYFYLGKVYKLRIGNYKEISVTDALNFPNFLVFRGQKELTSWYIRQAKEKILQRLQIHAAEMDATYTSILFSDTKSKWGTCGPENDLQFNWKLIMAPLMVLNYVVIHELAHTKEKNHSRRFWRIVERYTPAYRQHRKWLNSHAHLLTL